MKVQLWNRILIAIAGFLLLLISLCMLTVLTGILPVNGSIGEFVNALPLWGKMIGVAICLLIALLGVHGIGILVGRKKDQKYVEQQNENGTVSISLKAIEMMVRKCASSQKELRLRRIVVEKQGEGIAIEIFVFAPCGMNIPQITGAMQKQIRRYVSSCSGVPVEKVSMQVETDPKKKGYIPALLAPELEKAETAEKPIEKVEAVSAENAASEAVKEASAQALAEAEAPKSEKATEAFDEKAAVAEDAVILDAVAKEAITEDVAAEDAVAEEAVAKATVTWDTITGKTATDETATDDGIATDKIVADKITTDDIATNGIVTERFAEEEPLTENFEAK